METTDPGEGWTRKLSPNGSKGSSTRKERGGGKKKQEPENEMRWRKNQNEACLEVAGHADDQRERTKQADQKKKGTKYSPLGIWKTIKALSGNAVG